ncbi:MAG: LPS-assembly protein LptD [Thiobacillaceae bacterium]
MSCRRVLLAPLLVAAALHESPAQATDADQPPVPAPEPVRLISAYILEADRLQGQREGEVIAEGGVSITRADDRVQTEWLRYDRRADELEARGGVVYTRGPDRVEGTHLTLKLTERLGRMSEVRYLLHDAAGRMARGQAKAIDFQGRDKYRLEEATYTTCAADQADWVLQTRELKLDYDRSLGSARDVQVRYLDTPILYTPWLDFSLDDSRKSGFLTPSFGVSDQRGFEFTAPWYWNIAPNRDATFYPRLMSRRGLQLGTEYRYLSREYSGDVLLEALPRDRVAERGRYRGALRHNQRFSERWSADLNYERVTDARYFTDLASHVRDTSRVNLPQEGTLQYAGDGWRAVARLQSFQTLQDPAAPIDPPYRRLPQVVASGSRLLAVGLPLKLDAAGELVHFEHKDSAKAVGNRIDLYPSLSLNLANDYAFVTPKLGWRYTRYDLDRNPDPVTPTTLLGPLDQTRSLPILSLDSGLFLERTAQYFGRAFLQTLEPRAYYVYIPFKDQAGLPVFDTAVRDLSLDQLFSENQYSGTDRVNDARQLTLALTTRLLEPDTGSERLQATVGQRFYFSDQRVYLPGQPKRGGDSTDLLLQVFGQVTDRWRLTGGLQFNTDDGETAKANLGGNYRAGPGRVFNIDYRYINDRYAAGLDQLDLSWQWPLKPKWYGLGRINYSFQESRLVEGLLGFEYNAGCWSLRAVAQRLATSAENVSDAFFLQLELRGLTALGPNPLDVLKRSITGYAKSDEFNLP